MNGIKFMKWYTLIVGSIALVAMASSLGVWNTPLGTALIWCAVVWLVIAIVVVITAFVQTRNNR